MYNASFLEICSTSAESAKSDIFCTTLYCDFDCLFASVLQLQAFLRICKGDEVQKNENLSLLVYKFDAIAIDCFILITFTMLKTHFYIDRDILQFD